MTEKIELIDRLLFLKINSFHTPFLDFLIWQLSNSWHTYLIAIVLAFFFYKKFSMQRAIAFLLGIAIAVACTDITANLAKHTFKRYRPTYNLEIKDQVKIVNAYKGGQFGFFSGHAANSFAVATFLFLSFFWIKKSLRILFFVYAFLICYSRIYLGVHYPSDVFFGAIDGVIFGCITFFLFNKYFFVPHEK